MLDIGLDVRLRTWGSRSRVSPQVPSPAPDTEDIWENFHPSSEETKSFEFMPDLVSNEPILFSLN